MRTRRLLLLSMLGIASVLAQGSRGSITGTISDPAGAVIVNAAVEGKSIETGAVFSTVTTDTGNYTLSELPPGNYQVSFSAPGFKTLIRGPLEVSARQILRIDGTLEVGATTESVTVTDAARLLITESAEISYNVGTSRLNELPVGNMGTVRNIVRTAARLMPGVSFTEGFFGGVKINGTPTDGYNLRIDGMDNTYTLGNLLVSQVQPSVDAIEQYSIQTSNFAAELGQAGGAIFNVTMKSGTNQYHGSIYDYWAHDNLYAASPYVNPATGTKTKNPVSNYDWGFTVGGPVSIPKIYDGHDKTFFFWSYETRPQTGRNLNNFITVPTDAYRVGDLSAATALNNNRVLGTDPMGRSIIQNSVYDPASDFTFNGQVLRNAFTANQIPVARFDPVSVRVLNLVPKANVAGAGLLNNYNNPYDTATKNYLPSFKIDHSINSSNKLNFFYSKTFQRQPITTGEGLPTLISNSTRSQWDNVNVRLNYDATLSPTLLLHLGAGYQDATIGQVNIPTGFNATRDLGIPGPFTTNVYGATFPDFNGASSATVGGLPQLANTSFNGRTLTMNQRPTGIATLTWVKANHTYKFGGELRVDGFPNYNEIRLNGTYSFSGNQTALPYAGTAIFAGNTIGLGYASFLLGLVNVGNVSEPSNPHLGQHALGFYAQDTWKLNRKLTLDYGLRWDYSTYQTETYGRQSTLDPLRPNLAAGGQPGSTRYQATCGCTWSHNYPHSWGPRLGAAYQINSKTVLRGGIGLMYNTTARIGIAGRSLGSQNQVVPPSFGLPAMKLETGFTTLTLAAIRWPNFSPDYFPVRGASPGAANGNVFDQNAGRPSRQLQWSFGVQREIFRDLVIEASYVGNTGVWWPSGGLVNYNAIPFSTLQAVGINIDSTADAALLRSAISSSAVRARGFRIPFNGFPASATLGQALRPFPQFSSGLNAVAAPLGNTWYNSLQSKVTKRLSHGIDFSYSFTYQQSLTSNNVNDVFNRKNGKGLDTADQRLQSVIAFTYTVPKINGINRILAYVLYDWQVGAILSYASGFPIPAPIAQNNLATAIFQSTNAIRVPGVPLFLQDLNSGEVDPRRGFYLNPAAWIDPPQGQFGGPATYGDYRFQRRPNEAMNFGRNFRFGERVTAQARVEFQNIFNRIRPNNPASTNALAPQTPAPSINAVATGFGAISWQGTTGSRQGQMVFRLTF